MVYWVLAYVGTAWCCSTVWFCKFKAMLVANSREGQEHVSFWGFVGNSHSQTKMQQNKEKMLLCKRDVVAVYSLRWEYC